jgi:hypothetical protein
MLPRSLRCVAIACLVIASIAVGAGSAHAVAINNLVFEAPVMWGDGSGGQPSDAQMAALAASNAAQLGVPVDQIGKVDTGDGTAWTFTPLSPFTSGMFTSFTCNGGSTTPPCNTGSGPATGFMVQFDFTALASDWQIVKIVVKPDGPQFPWGAFVINKADLQVEPLDNIQAAFISNAEYAKFIAAGDLLACATANACTDGYWNPGISSIHLFGTPSTPGVPEPGTLLLLGLGLLGVGAAARKKIAR